ITLALGMVVWGLAHRWVTMTQGDNGISAISRPDLCLPWSLALSIPFYYFALAGFLVSFWILRAIVRSPFGQTLVGIRESESRMRTLGYHVWLHKYIGFVIAGGFGGFAGVLWAYYNGFVSPVDLQLATSVEVLLMVALGGRGTLLGPALGAGIIVFLKNLVSVYTHCWLLILGAVYIATIVYAPEGNPSQTLTKLRQLVDSAKALVLAGAFLASKGYALAPKIDEYQIPTLFPVVSADDLTQRKPVKWLVRTGWTSSQPNQPFGEYVAKTLGYKKVVTIAMDYAFGWEQVGGFQRTFEEAGGQIVQKLWPPLGTTDFGPFLAQIKRDADAVFGVMVAASALRFPK